MIRELLLISTLTFVVGCGGSDTEASSAGAACNGTSSAQMVALPGGYSIDSTEVTRCQYAAWLQTKPTISNQALACAWNTDYTPACGWPPTNDGNLPVVCVDWCDAYAYCAAMGKRLCGKIGGGSNAGHADASASQWYAACSSGGLFDFPYGDAYDGQACNSSDVGYLAVEVGSMPGCQSTENGYEGVYDLSGNVWEWEDSCDGDTGTSDICSIRGGSYNGEGMLVGCGVGVSLGDRDFVDGDIGFRCCSSP